MGLSSVLSSFSLSVFAENIGDYILVTLSQNLPMHSSQIANDYYFACWFFMRRIYI